MTTADTLAQRAAALDAADALAHFKAGFHVPPGTIYLDGNSLGLLQPSVASRTAAVVNREWGDGLIGSWTAAGWFHLPLSVGDRIAPILGVGAGEVAVGDATSVNLFKCMAAALQLRPGRRVILAEGGNFPTDSYMAQGLARLLGDVEVRYTEPGEDMGTAVTADVAVVLASHVDYRSAEIKDMTAINRTAHAKGALVVWDLSHSTGAVPLALTASNCDMAVGCTYKYLNGGPGAPAFVWVRPSLLEDLRHPLEGWMGHAEPFAFQRDYAPASGIRRMVCGTPHIVSLSALDEALKIWQRVDLDKLYEKSRVMTAFFIEAVETLAAGHGLCLAVPRDAGRRGSHVSFEHPRGFEAVQALIARGVIGDFRAPATMRFGFAPLYLSFADVLTAARHLADIFATRAYDRPEFKIKGDVT